jgi:hypothetical protein
METENYVVSIKTRKGGRIVLKTSDKCHKAKSFAGSIFHSDNVESVYVGDIKGNHYLYLKKDEKGNFISEKFENIPSELAIFG